MVFIHGGGYFMGDGGPGFYGPERFMDYNVVGIAFILFHAF